MLGSATALGYGIVAAGWALWGAGWLTGAASAFGHDRLIQDQGVGLVSLALSVVGWQVMIAAMMVPSSLPQLRAVDEAEGGRSVLRGATFLTGYFAVWSAFGAFAFLADGVLHRVVDASSFLSAHPWIVSAGLVSLAAGYEVASLRKGHAAAPVISGGSLGPRRWLAAGAGHGTARVRRCWAVMLLSFAFGMESLAWMVLLTSMMLLDRPRPAAARQRMRPQASGYLRTGGGRRGIHLDRERQGVR